MQRKHVLFATDIVPGRFYFYYGYIPVIVDTTTQRGWKRGFLNWFKEGTWDCFYRLVYAINPYTNKKFAIQLQWDYSRCEYHFGDTLFATMPKSKMEKIEADVKNKLLIADEERVKLIHLKTAIEMNEQAHSSAS